MLSIRFSCATDALFRSMGSVLAGAMETGGLIRTADTGQIDWATVLRPSGTNVFAGYEIRRFSDANQAASPVFIKIEFGSLNTTGICEFAFTVGTGSDGDGNITGVFFNRKPLIMTYVAAAASDVPFCCSSGMLVFCGYFINDPYTKAGRIFIVERTRDNTGAVNSNGVFICENIVDSTFKLYSSTYVFSNNYVFGPRLGLPCLAIDGTTWQVGADVGITPVFPVSFGPHNPSTALAGYFLNDVTENNIITLAPYGEDMSFIALGASLNVTIHANTSIRVLLRCS